MLPSNSPAFTMTKKYYLSNFVDWVYNFRHMDSLMLHSDSYIEEEHKIQYRLESIKDELINELPPTGKTPSQDEGAISGLNPAHGNRPEQNFDGLGLNRGHWLVDENKRYHWFLEIHYQHFLIRHMRRMDKIFKTMEQFVGSRLAQQCRSHHQKMQKKYQTFPGIVASLRCKHYGSLEEIHLITDMQANGIDYGDAIATMQQLEYESKTFKAPATHRKKGVHYKKRLGFAQPQMSPIFKPTAYAKEEDGVQRQHVNIEIQLGHLLEESNMNMGEMMLYHEKEDISCLFNNGEMPLPESQLQLDSGPSAEVQRQSHQSLFHTSQ